MVKNETTVWRLENNLSNKIKQKPNTSFFVLQTRKIHEVEIMFRGLPFPHMLSNHCEYDVK